MFKLYIMILLILSTVNVYAAQAFIPSKSAPYYPENCVLYKSNLSLGMNSMREYDGKNEANAFLISSKLVQTLATHLLSECQHIMTDHYRSEVEMVSRTINGILKEVASP